MSSEKRARTVSETERTQTVTLLTCTVEQQPDDGCKDGLVRKLAGWGGLLSKVISLLFVLAMSKGLRSFHLLLLLSSTKNVNVLALSRELGYMQRQVWRDGECKHISRHWERLDED